MKALLSIKPEYVKKIFSGEKRYEFRKVIFKNKNVNGVVIYASSPISKVVGEFTVDHIIEDTPQTIWNRTKDVSGVDESFFYNYFKGRDKGYAIKLKKIKKYEDPFSLDKIGIKYAPQSFIYLK